MEWCETTQQCCETKRHVRARFGVQHNLEHQAVYDSLYSTGVLHVSAAVNTAREVCTTRATP